jgi:amino acid permease
MIAAAHIRAGGDFLVKALQWHDKSWCPQIVGTVVSGILIFAVALWRDLRLLSCLSMATVPLTIAGVIGAICVLGPGIPLTNKGDPAWPQPVGTETVTAILCVLFTFLIHPTSPAVMSSMKDVK